MTTAEDENENDGCPPEFRRLPHHLTTREKEERDRQWKDLMSELYLGRDF